MVNKSDLSNPGVIIFLAVMGIVVLALLVGCLWMLRRPKPRQSRASPLVGSSSESTVPPDPRLYPPGLREGEVPGNFAPPAYGNHIHNPLVPVPVR